MSRGGLRWGRHHISVENCHSLSAWGRFVWAWNGDEDDKFKVKWTGDQGGYFILDYKRDGGKYQERISFTKTPCHFGGSRIWLDCPGCGRRVGKLYLPTTLYSNYNDGVRVQNWRCRYFYKLTYEQRRSRNLSRIFEWRAQQVAQKLIEKKNHFYKPKNMHWKTFDNLVDKWNALTEQENAHFLSGLPRSFMKSFLRYTQKH